MPGQRNEYVILVRVYRCYTIILSFGGRRLEKREKFLNSPNDAGQVIDTRAIATVLEDCFRRIAHHDKRWLAELTP